MQRRDFIILLGSAAWPLIARAQQTERMRRVGVLTGIEDDAEGQARFTAFLQRLAQLGWTDGGNVRIDLRWGGANLDDIGKYAKELVALAPDVILTEGATSLTSLRQATRSIPIVFVLVVDPVGGGHVDTLSRPGGNATGFMQFEYSLGREMAGIAQGDHAGRHASGGASGCRPTPAGPGQFAVMRTDRQPLMGIEVSAINVNDAAGKSIERLAAFARIPMAA